MSASLLYMCRKFPGMLPFALFFVAVVLSVMGAAYFTVLAFLAPITILICEEAKMDKLTGAVAINCGALAGGNFPTASLGVVFRGLIDTAYEAEPAFERYAFSDTAVALETEAENCNQNQRKYNRETKNFHFIYKGIRCFKCRKG